MLTKRLALIGLLATLWGCNSTDALTPQVDVGGGTFASPPVTQSDLDQMSAESQPVGGAQQTAFATPPQTTLTSPSGGNDTLGTLEAQAEALARNDQGAAATTAGSTAEGTARSRTETPPAAETATETAARPPETGGESIRFLPIIGAPVEAVTPLSRQLGAQARANGLTIRSASDAAGNHILKGYFSAVNDGGSTTVVYVWDVLDGSGARLHRIQGQDSVQATAADPWAAIPARTMETIAERTIRDYLDWRQRTPG